MKKIVIILISISLVLVGSLLLLAGQEGYSSRDVLTSGTYIFGEDIKDSNYMYQLTGPGEIKITRADQEVYYAELLEGESVHEHYLPVVSGDTIEITNSATLELM